MKSLVLRCGLLRVTLLGVLSWSLVGCSLMPPPSTDPTRYFVLADSAPAAAPTEDGQRGTSPGSSPSEWPAPRRSSGIVLSQNLLLGLRAVELPTYLRTSKSLVVRRGTHEIRYDDFARWGEPLEAGLHRVLRERLLTNGRVAQVALPPFPFDARRDYEIRVRVLHCEGAIQGDQAVARFAAVYEIFPGSDPAAPVVPRTLVSLEVPWDGQDPAALVALLSDAARRLGEDIASHLPL